MKEDELPERLRKETEKIKKEEMFHESDVVYSVGDNVFHSMFGYGKVVSINKDLISIAFKHPYGVKTMMKNHKSISKI